MKHITMSVLMTLTSVLPLAGTLAAQVDESLFGTWKMNPAKSRFNPGPTPKRSMAKWDLSTAALG